MLITEKIIQNPGKVNFLLILRTELKYKKVGIRKLKFGSIQSWALACC
jgi:hypothetical protein